MSPTDKAEAPDDAGMLHRLNRLLIAARRLGWPTARQGRRIAAHEKAEVMALISELSHVLRALRRRAEELECALSSTQINVRANIAYRNAKDLRAPARKH